MIAHVLGIGDLVGQTITKRRSRLPCFDLLMPGGKLVCDWPLFDHVPESAQGVLDVADDRQVRRLVLIDLRRIYIGVNDGATLAELFHFAGDAVVKPNAARQEQISTVSDFSHGLGSVLAWLVFAVYRQIGKRRAMHTEPTQGQWVGLRKRSTA